MNKRNLGNVFMIIVTVGLLMLLTISRNQIAFASNDKAKVDGISYESLQEAVNQGGNVVLMDDIYLESTVVINVGQTVSIDLNGHNITVYKDEVANRSLYAFNNYGNLTLLDSVGSGYIRARGVQNLDSGSLTINSGKIIACDSNGGAAIWNTANLVVNGGTFTNEFVGTPSDTYGVGCLYNTGTAYINGGEFNGLNRRNYAIISTNYIEITPSEGADVTVHGAHGGLAIDSGSAIVNGGNFSSTEYYGLYVSNDGQGLDPEQAVVEVNGGTFTGARYSILLGSDINDPVNSTVEVNGGYFIKPIDAQSVAIANALKLKGGTFIEEPASSYIDVNYEIILEEGKYVIKEKVQKLTLSHTNVNLEIGKQFQLNASVLPTSITYPIVWSSSDTNVATIDQKGLITGNKIGSTTIKATLNNKSVSCAVNIFKIEEPEIPKPPISSDNDTTIYVEKDSASVLANALSNTIKNLDKTNAVSDETKVILQEAIDAGKQIAILPEITKMKEDKIEASIVEKVEKVISKKANIAQYFDLSMLIKVEGTQVGTLNELESKVSFKINISKDLIKEGRQFYMVRIHDGKAERIQGDLKGNTFTFETDKFSIYALVYEDPSNVETGDKTNKDALIMLMSISFMMIMAIVSRKRNTI